MSEPVPSCPRCAELLERIAQLEQQVRALEARPGRRVTFSPDGRYALSASPDRMVVLWDVESGREVRSFKGHTDLVWCVAFSPDGSRALSAGRDKTVRLWDVESGRELRRFEGSVATFS